ncbi:hypothetical protein BN59_02671 [Legionella massiliensis]|uniref:Uncharacterized protein n=1 Tax=Legionella massiliensis TaxID=1034943 RepID=A0A078KZL8_9GAMM|nr:hypothetical protein [Legionella massiliensis]CDZ78361.1 hypothetical protein BN59_02671 [Legionella massiliensis]CEE14099.1 hypothetical protein BN1094_02671 [Legionella massiliensis]
MKKVNGRYQSLFEYLVEKRFPFARTIDAYLYPVEHATLNSSSPYSRRYDDVSRGFWADHFIGSVQPLASMLNDVEYTFKPYKSGWELLMDFAQPFRGVSNILRGLANVIAAPIIFLGNLFRYTFIETNSPLDDIQQELGQPIFWFIDGLSSLLRGATQIISTPLTWCIRTHLRSVITNIVGFPDIRENEEIQYLVSRGTEAFDESDANTMNCIKHRLHEEYQKSLAKGQSSVISPKREEAVFRSTEVSYKDYFGLFRKPEGPRATTMVVDQPTNLVIGDVPPPLI